MANEIIPLKTGMVNCYLIKAGDGFVLVDTGISLSRAVLDRELEKNGCIPGKLKLIIMTHGDIDHSGNAFYLSKKFSVKTAMNVNDSAMVESGKMLMDRGSGSLTRKIFQFFLFRLPKFRKVIEGFERFTPDVLLEDGFSLADYGVDAKIILVPGHTPGSLGVFMADGDFIAGDTLNNNRKPVISPIVHNEAQLNDSIEKIKLLGIRTVYPGHGRPFMAVELFK